jgi:hypothetical protein
MELLMRVPIGYRHSPPTGFISSPFLIWVNGRNFGYHETTINTIISRALLVKLTSESHS